MILPYGNLTYNFDFEIPFYITGEIEVSLIAPNACFTDTLKHVFLKCDLEEIALKVNIQIYPNPTQRSTVFETSKGVDNLFIYHDLGEEVLG
ncbi:MAG: hypothetical protein ACJA1A_002205 [Saprospiraceae bacterium]